MTTFNTGNPLGSSAPKDLFDNAENLDLAVNRQQSTWTDRFGVERQSFWGFENEFDSFMTQSESRVDAFLQASQESFDEFLASSGYQVIGDYAAGITLTSYSQLVRYEGDLYRASAELDLPYTTTGVWAEEEELFVSVGDAALRQELTTPNGAQLIGFSQDDPQAVSSTVLRKLRETVSVEDFRLPGDADDTASFIRACSKSRVVIASGSAYVLKGEIPIVDGCHLQFTGNPSINFDLSGENGRGFLQQDNGNSSVTGAAKIDTYCIVSGSDGSRNGLFTMGTDFYVTDDPSVVRWPTVAGDFRVRMHGPANAKVWQGNGYLEDALVQGVYATGQTNFAFVAHWIGNGLVGVLPTKTWHPNRITLRACVAEHIEGSGNLLRAFTFSGCGKVNLESCISRDPMLLGFNLFVGDYGGTYSQNVSQNEMFNFVLSGCAHRGTSAPLSVDAVSSRLNGSPLWAGCDHNAFVSLDGDFFASMRSGAAAINVGIAGLRELSGHLRVIEDEDGNPSQAMYLTSISKVNLTGQFRTRGGVLVRDCGNVELNMDSFPLVESPNAASYRVGSSASSTSVTSVGETAIGASEITLSAVTVFTGPGGYLQYNDGTRTYEIPLRSLTFNGGAQSVKIAPSPVLIPDGATLTLIQTVRGLYLGPSAIGGVRTPLQLTGSAIAKPRNVRVDATFRRSGLADINAAAVDGLTVSSLASFDDAGQTNTTSNTFNVALGPNAEAYVIAGRYGKNNHRVRYCINCDNASKNGFIGGALFESVSPTALNAAAIFKSTATNVIIGQNCYAAGVAPVYPAA